LCAQFGVSEKELEMEEEEPELGSYGGFLLDVGLQGVLVSALDTGFWSYGPLL
jgi:thiaminase